MEWTITNNNSRGRYIINYDEIDILYLKIDKMGGFTKPIKEPYIFLHNEVIFLKRINPYKAVDELGIWYLTFHKPETLVKCRKLLKKYLTNHLDLTEIQNEETN